MPSKKKTKNVEKNMMEGGHNLFQNGKVAAMDVFAVPMQVIRVDSKAWYFWRQ